MNVYLIRNRKTKEPIRISIFSNEGAEFCSACGARFDTSGESIYAVPDYSTASGALDHDPKWFNASLEHPEWPTNFDPSQWEVFQVDIG